MKYHTNRKRMTRDEIEQRITWCQENLADDAWTWDISNYPYIKDEANRTVFRFADYNDWILFRLCR